MDIITTTAALEAFVDSVWDEDFVCVDTEFMRESTYYSQLCLIQASSENTEVIIDPLADGIDLDAFLQLMTENPITKVMHAARQDMEIFYDLTKRVTKPLFDTQVAAMALGYGDSVSYMGLVKGELDVKLDKGARFTDWSKRPLSDKQLTYAIGDVTHLRDLYPGLVAKLKDRGREAWVSAEMEPLMREDLYTFEPERAWERLKVRNPKRGYLGVLKAAAAWREREAKSANKPRRRVLKDDALYDIAQNKPTSVEALGKLRGVPNGFERSSKAKGLLEAVKHALDHEESYAPRVPKTQHMPPNLGPRIEMLRTLLRLKTEYENIAPRMVANAADIEQLAAFGPKADIAALRGWRRDAFGEHALAMLRGEIGLRLDGKKVVAVPLNPDADT